MSTSLVAIGIDCAEAPAVARFWADVLGRQVAEDSTSERVILLPGDGDTFDAETERLQSLGAHRLRDLQRDKSRRTSFADIEGNEFDLIAGVDPPRP
jgi:hypothetical protein